MYIDNEINNLNISINRRVDSINTRIDDIEARIDNLDDKIGSRNRKTRDLILSAIREPNRINRTYQAPPLQPWSPPPSHPSATLAGTRARR